MIGAMTIYVAGSMSSRFPDRNFPLFHAAAKKLRALGHEVVNPAELGEVEGRAWSTAMRSCLSRILEDCNAIYMIPGWEGCAGPTIELLAALACGCSVVDGEGRVVNAPAATLWTGDILELRLKHG